MLLRKIQLQIASIESVPQLLQCLRDVTSLPLSCGNPCHPRPDQRLPTSYDLSTLNLNPSPTTCTTRTSQLNAAQALHSRKAELLKILIPTLGSGFLGKTIENEATCLCLLVIGILGWVLRLGGSACQDPKYRIWGFNVLGSCCLGSRKV